MLGSGGNYRDSLGIDLYYRDLFSSAIKILIKICCYGDDVYGTCFNLLIRFNRSQFFVSFFFSIVLYL